MEINSDEEYSWQIGFKNAVDKERAATMKVIEYIHKLENTSVILTESEEVECKKALDIASIKTLKDYIKNYKKKLNVPVPSLDYFSVDKQISSEFKNKIFEEKLQSELYYEDNCK